MDSSSQINPLSNSTANLLTKFPQLITKFPLSNRHVILNLLKTADSLKNENQNSSIVTYEEAIKLMMDEAVKKDRTINSLIKVIERLQIELKISLHAAKANPDAS